MQDFSKINSPILDAFNRWGKMDAANVFSTIYKEVT